MKATVGEIIEKIEAIEYVIHQLESMKDECLNYEEIQRNDLAIKHLEEYKYILFKTKVEV